MSGAPEIITDLKDKLAKAEAKVGRIRASLTAATKEYEELVTAISVLTKHGYVAGDAGKQQPVVSAATGFTNANHALLFISVPEGEQYAVSPKEVTDLVHRDGRADLTPDYIRTVLWRMADRGTLQSKDGRYWRPKKEEAPAEAEASNFMGPVGRERGYPPSTPEGSTPSGSTPSQPEKETDWEDDVPF